MLSDFYSHDYNSVAKGYRCLACSGGAGFESHQGNILISPCPSKETVNRGPNTPIPMTHALICEELKDPGIPPKVDP